MGRLALSLPLATLRGVMPTLPRCPIAKTTEGLAFANPTAAMFAIQVVLDQHGASRCILMLDDGSTLPVRPAPVENHTCG